MKKKIPNFPYSNYLTQFMRLLDYFKMTNVLMAGISVAFFSCGTLVNDVNPDLLPRSDSKLVVHGYLSPQDTVIAINVYYSSQLIGGSQDIYVFSRPAVSLPDAVVTLTHQGKSVTIPYDAKNGIYNLKANAMPIVEGQTYELKVIRNGETAESSCTVPKAVAIQRIRQDSVDSKVLPKEYLYHIVWEDPAGQANFYRVGGYVFQTRRNQITPTTFSDIPTIQPLNFRENNRTGEFITDERTNGILMVSGPGRFTVNNGSGSTSVLTNQYVELALLNCEKTYYDYHLAVRNFDGNNPFAEPSLIPSNIKNGLGCFAAYNRSTFVLKN